MGSPSEALKQLGSEARLAHPVAAQELARKIEVTNADYFFSAMIGDAGLGRGAGFAVIIESAFGT
jgi:hypothetical protein